MIVLLPIEKRNEILRADYFISLLLMFSFSSINALFSDPFLDKYQSYLKVDAQLIKRRCTVC